MIYQWFTWKYNLNYSILHVGPCWVYQWAFVTRNIWYPYIILFFLFILGFQVKFATFYIIQRVVPELQVAFKCSSYVIYSYAHDLCIQYLYVWLEWTVCLVRSVTFLILIIFCLYFLVAFMYRDKPLVTNSHCGLLTETPNST